MLDTLSARIWQVPQFHKDFEALQSSHVRNRLSIEGGAPLEWEVLARLVKSALILAASPDAAHQTTAYKIATAASQLRGVEFDGIPHLMYIVLSRLGNFPAIDFAKKRFEISPFKLPVRLAVEATDRLERNTVELDGTQWSLTDFQLDLWQKLVAGVDVGISAPTSAGKSFILQSFVRKQIASGAVKNAGFLVPTRALINEVAERVGSWVGSVGVDVELVTIPISPDEELPDRGVYVVTQERLQLIMESHPELKLDLLVIDEAQSVGDGPRGVLLSSVIQDALSRDPNCQLLFSGPNIANPEQFGRIFGRVTTAAKTELATVAQNIIFVDCNPIETEKATLSLLDGVQKIPLGEVSAGASLNDHRSKLINLSKLLGNNGQTLVYAMGAAECEDIAFGLADGELAAHSPKRASLGEFIGEAVHPKFLLSRSVLSGVGYHYGRLPALVRKEVEDAFAEGELQYLATTSTLLYGVNLPARNLFLHNPKRGKDTPISTNDFWNLAGRAGRLGKEFEGNIFLIDYGDWATDPMTGAKDRTIEPALERHLTTEIGALIKYMNDPTVVPERSRQDEYENTFAKLYRDFIEGTLSSTLGRIGIAQGSKEELDIVDALARAKSSTQLPIATFNASPTVSIYRQQSLYDRLTAGLAKKGPEYVIPRHPMNKDAYPALMAALKRCHGEILKLPKSDKSHVYFAMLALRWMKGQPLPQMIDDAYDYLRKQGANPNISTVIRNVMSEVENDLRFKYVRLMGCYNAVLRQVLQDNGFGQYAARIPGIPLYLEIGACSATMMSFMSLGLSRYTAAKLARLPANQDMSQTQAKRWILGQQVDALNIPMASVKEIKALIR